MKDVVAGAIADLESWFSSRDSALVALSGGVDSSLVAFLARKWLGADRSLAVIGDSASLKRRDYDEAVAFCATHRINFVAVATEELASPCYLANPVDRCYHCKRDLFTRLTAMGQEKGIATILGGENRDDEGDYRPGMLAAREFGVLMPLKDCGIPKALVRDIARYFSLTVADKPASPCLSSRVPYGQAIHPAKLMQIEQAEECLLAAGFSVARVRHYGETARIEVENVAVPRLNAKLELITARLRELGFMKVEVDPEGFVSGKLNRAHLDGGKGTHGRET